jgi:membrane protein implicated in regulation of membrane protease activity
VIHLTLAIVDFMMLLLKAALQLAGWIILAVAVAAAALWLVWREMRKRRDR